VIAYVAEDHQRTMISTTVFTETGTVALTGAATAGLAAILIAIELASAGESEFLRCLRRNLVVFAVPLLVVFVCVAVVALVKFVTA
jgi:hypothetical protein